MARPIWEVADIIRIAGSKLWKHLGGSLNWGQLKVLYAIVSCRTAVLGGHRDRCVSCGYQAISFHSCRNRHCPKCQVNARQKWLRKRQEELLPVGYFHIVFSVPHRLVPLMWQNKKLLFSLLFQTTAATLLEVAARRKRLGMEIGFLCILHTWGQTMQRHPHRSGLRYTGWNMPLIALELRCSPASFARNSQCRPEVCPNHEKLLFFQVIKPALERYFSSFFINHHQMQRNLSFQPLFLPYSTRIENP